MEVSLVISLFWAISLINYSFYFLIIWPQKPVVLVPHLLGLFLKNSQTFQEKGDFIHMLQKKKKEHDIGKKFRSASVSHKSLAIVF